MSSVSHKIYKTPIGLITIAENGTAITHIHFGEPDDLQSCGTDRSTQLLEMAFTQLSEYFSGSRTVFDLPLCPAGTEFQQKVWRALQEVPYGETRTYGEIAARVGSPKASRAVGMANHHNPIAIVIPCHRIIGKNGTLTGYAGGLSIKQTLLQLEKTPGY